MPRTETRWFTGDRGFAIVAAASFAAGETIEAREGEPVCVVSSGAMRRFEPVMRQTSGTYPRPLASHTVALASPDPEDWRPYGHRYAGLVCHDDINSLVSIMHRLDVHLHGSCFCLFSLRH